MTAYIGYTVWQNANGRPFQTVYVAQVPGDGGKDWGYTYARERAAPLNLYWRRRFERDMALCGRVGSFSPL